MSVLHYTIVEDSLKVCNGIKERMDSFDEWDCCGFLHHTAEAIERIIEHKPQLIFIDWALKGGSAYDVLSGIRGLPDYNPYIIFNTGYQSENPDIPQHIFNNYRIDKYLVKPIWEKLRLKLPEFLQEAKLKYLGPPEKSPEIWLTDNSKNRHRINPKKIVCVIQDFENPYNKTIILEGNHSLNVKISWPAVHDLLSRHQIDFFVTNTREHVIVKDFIHGYKRPFVHLHHIKQRIEVVKNKLCAFEKWLEA